MKIQFKPAFAAGLALFAGAVAVSTPATAQVNGIATANPTAVILRAAARNTAYTQIQQTYAAQITQVNTLSTEIQTLQRSLDTNSDNQISDAEITAKPAVVQQIQAKEQQLQTASQPIAMAQYYVIEQLINDYENAQTQVISNKKIQLILAPEAIQYGPDSLDVTTDIVTALNTRLPTVTTTVPAGWQPRRDTVQTHQAIQQIMVAAAQQAAARQQQQPAANPNAGTGR